jgi:hypothetical protein
MWAGTAWRHGVPIARRAAVWIARLVRPAGDALAAAGRAFAAELQASALLAVRAVAARRRA